VAQVADEPHAPPAAEHADDVEASDVS